MSMTTKYLRQYENVLRMFHIPIRMAGGTSDHFKVSGKENTTNMKEFGPQTAQLAHSVPR